MRKIIFDRRPISIHAPREGSDTGDYNVRRIKQISIHAPREGSDIVKFKPLFQFKDFNPRSP